VPKCHSCGAEIVFIKTTAGKYMPCDAGLILFDECQHGGKTFVTPDGRVVGGALPVGNNVIANPQKGYTPHWANCNAPGNFRKKAGGHE
jgi:hypothetical protein